MSVDPEEVEREEAIIEIERTLLRRIINAHAKVWVDFAEDTSDRVLVTCLHDLINLCDEGLGGRVKSGHVRSRLRMLEIGWCRKCGAERKSVEPDARGSTCESCGAAAVDGVKVWCSSARARRRK